MRTVNTRIRDLAAYLDTYLERYSRDKTDRVEADESYETRKREKLREIMGMSMSTRRATFVKWVC